MLSIKILSENRTQKRGILAEHGLSMLIQSDDFKILMDTGQSDIFALNAEKMGIDLSYADAVVISHGHYDHTGGLPEFCRINKNSLIYIHPDAFCERYSESDSCRKKEYIGIEWEKDEKDEILKRTVFTKDPLKIHDKIFISGEVPRVDPFSNTKGFVKKSGSGIYEKDDVADEQFLMIQGRNSLYIFLGCSHPGIINCIRHAKSICRDFNNVRIVGGLHLKESAEDEIKNVMIQMKNEGIEQIIPLHCTGISAADELKRFFKEKCLLICSGDEYILEN